MRVIRLILLLDLFLCLFNACIDPFTPSVDEGDQFVVIHGGVTDEEGYQYADISITSSYNNPEYKPVNDCRVKIIDGNGSEFEMSRYDDGKYRAWIEKSYLQIGNQFKIEVILNDGEGKKYESQFDTLLPCPEIDNIYYEYQEVTPDDPESETFGGIQFYIDFDATGNYSNNFRYEAIETWEYRAEERTYIIYRGVDWICCYGEIHYPINHPCYYRQKDECDYWLDIKYLNPLSREDEKIMDSLYTCWKTTRADGIYTYTTHQKRDKKVIGLPLYFITNEENRLTRKYSILIKQISLSDVSFKYWDHLRMQSDESGGLYDTQPYELQGNIKCMDDENEKVIGIFSASSVKTKRFITTIRMNRNNYYCFDIVEGWDNLQRVLWGGEPGFPSPPNELTVDTPLYLHPFFDEMGRLRSDTFSLIDQSCIDCRLKGGTLTKPDYWDE